MVLVQRRIRLTKRAIHAFSTTGVSGFITGGHPGDEHFAHDVGVVKWDGDAGAWTDKSPGKNGCSKEDYLVWDKPVYALADGLVECVEDSNQDNEPEKCGNDVTDYGLNLVVIRHGDELVSYLHLKQGSAAVTKGQVVKAGMKVGHVGNSGAKTSHTHLHIHATKGGHLRPLHFKCVMVLNHVEFNPENPTSGPWLELDGRALPFEKTISWPSPGSGSAEIARHAIPAESYQNVVSNITACGYMPCWVDGFEVNGKTTSMRFSVPRIAVPSPQNVVGFVNDLTNGERCVGASDIQPFPNALDQRLSTYEAKLVERLQIASSTRDLSALRPPDLEIATPVAGVIQLKWEQKGWQLQGSLDLSSWSDVPDVTSPYRAAPNSSLCYFRLR